MYNITLAVASDVDGITALLQNNSPARGGALTGEFPRDKVAKMALSAAPVVVAHRDDQVVGVLFSAARDKSSQPASIQAMLAAWPGGPEAYVYGPACIAATERGRGILAKLYSTIQQYYPGREAILYVRRDNTISMRAHECLGMREVAGFFLDGVDYAVLSDRERLVADPLHSSVA